MQFLKKLFGANGTTVDAESQDDDPVVPVPIPPFVTILAALEREKGWPLTESEVWGARDKAVCMTMRASMRDQMAEARGFADIDMENAWAEWQVVRQSVEFGKDQ
jgi:hypothetical protein